MNLYKSSLLTLGDLTTGARFFRQLPSFLRRRIDTSEARGILKRRLEHRGADFLWLVHRTVYQHAESPYRRLLDLAGCGYGDLERLVTRDGAEGALHTLLRHGVYLTLDEFKGRRPVVRGSARIEINPDQFSNPLTAPHVRGYTSGSRGVRSPVVVNLDSVWNQTVNLCLTLEAHGAISWQHAYWEVPGGSSIVHILECVPFAPPVRWFSQVDPLAPDLHPRYRWSARLVRSAGTLAGVRLPGPQHVSLDDPLPIIRWMVDTLHTGQTPHLKTFASSAVRVCQAAMAKGIDLHGARFTVTGEPVTALRLAAIRRAGAEAAPRCGTSETGLLAHGCLAPEAPDDLHFHDDLHAVIQPAGMNRDEHLSPSSLLLTSLRPAARSILLNVSLGDQANMTHRTCGCPLGQLGWKTHLHTLRSQEKLTAGGMTLLDSDVIRVLEEALPAQFGGGPTHYQLVEEEAADGHPRVRLLVHPAVGPLDETRLTDAFFAAIGGGSSAERVMELQWRQAGLLQVKRRPPLATASGKILHRHRGHRLQP